MSLIVTDFEVLHSDMKRIGDTLSMHQADFVEAGGILPPEHFTGRKGYSPDFISGWPLKFPKAFGSKERDMLSVKRGDTGVELKYTHFSLIMSKSRKLTMITGTNINGAQSKKLPRSDKWYLDGRIDTTDQIGNELYLHNRLDRGHMVRREDPVWGSEAATANTDTFCYPNSCPQMDRFNQQTWLGLEDYILQNARVDKMTITVFTGPFFSHDDPEYNDVLIPKAFWKVIAFLKEDGQRCATAYKVSQENILKELEIVYGPYLTYQVSVQQIMDETSMDFSEMIPYDGFSQYEFENNVALKSPIRDLNDVMI